MMYRYGVCSELALGLLKYFVCEQLRAKLLPSIYMISDEIMDKLFFKNWGNDPC